MVERGGGAASTVNWQQGSNRLLMIPEPGACGPLIEAHDRWDADPVSSSVMQTREAGGTEWPSSAEDRLQAFVQRRRRDGHGGRGPRRPQANARPAAGPPAQRRRLKEKKRQENVQTIIITVL